MKPTVEELLEKMRVRIDRESDEYKQWVAMEHKKTTLLCPYCDCDLVHFKEPRLSENKIWIDFFCETGGHNWLLTMEHEKGTTKIWRTQIPDTPCNDD